MKDILLDNNLIVTLSEEDYEKIIDNICRPHFMEINEVKTCKCSIRKKNSSRKKRIKNCTLTVSKNGVHLGYSVNKKHQ